MKFVRFLGALLCVIGCIIALAGILATALPLINNEQVNSIISSFSVTSENPLMNLVNKAGLLCINYHYYVFGGGVLMLLFGGLIHTAADNKINKDLFFEDDDSLFEPNPPTPKAKPANATEEWTVEKHLASTQQAAKNAVLEEPVVTPSGSILDLNEPDDTALDSSDQLVTPPPVAAYMPKPSSISDTQPLQNVYPPILASRDTSGLEQAVSYEMPPLDTHPHTQPSVIPVESEIQPSYSPNVMYTPVESHSEVPSSIQQAPDVYDVSETFSPYSNNGTPSFTEAPTVPTYGKRQRTLIFPDIPKKGEMNHFKVTETSYYPTATEAPPLKNRSISSPVPVSRPKEAEMVAMPAVPKPAVYTTTPKAPERVVFSSIQGVQSKTVEMDKPATTTWDFPVNGESTFVAKRQVTQTQTTTPQNSILRATLAVPQKSDAADVLSDQSPITRQPSSAKLYSQAEDILVSRSPKEETATYVQPSPKIAPHHSDYFTVQDEQAIPKSNDPDSASSPALQPSQSNRPRIVSTMGKKSTR